MVYAARRAICLFLAGSNKAQCWFLVEMKRKDYSLLDPTSSHRPSYRNQMSASFHAGYDDPNLAEPFLSFKLHVSSRNKWLEGGLT
jgi:hypothetical protein